MGHFYLVANSVALHNKDWRVLHRVTYVERPALTGFGRELPQRTDVADDAQELRKQVHELTGRMTLWQNTINAKLDELLSKVK
ncbi:MAG: hypothetical protein L0Z53_01595 [Acidobacteriales bacterium]|nr:hypothetical protein [Terriglobales bacterium]